MATASSIPQIRPTSTGSSSTLDAPDVAPNGDQSRTRSRSSNGESSKQTWKRAERLSVGSTRNRANSRTLSSWSETASSTHKSHDHGEVRTLPPWIDSYEKDEPVPASRATDLLLPPQAHSAQHHFSTSRPERRRSQDGYVSSDDEAPSDNPPRTPDRGLFGAKEPVRGRKWDHARQGDPVIVPASSKTIYQWKTFIHSSMYGPPMDEEAELVDPSFLDEQTPGYRKPWCGDAGGEDPEKLLGLSPRKKKQRVWYERMQYTLVMHPLVPLLFRVIVLTTSTLALGLSCSIYHLTHYSPFPQNPSTIMAIVVDAVALPYIGYITWDEYTGKPLGLRSPKAKISLVLLDLFFIVFESANLALAFDALKNTSGSCQPGTNGTNYTICSRVQTLSSFLFIALVAWILTFSVSILRLVERVGSRDGKDDS